MSQQKENTLDPGKQRALSNKLLEASREGDTELVLQVLAEGANVNATDNYGNTPLQWAAIRGYTEIVHVLLKAEANVNLINSYGGMLLNDTAYRGHTAITKALIDAGATVNALNEGTKEQLFKRAIEVRNQDFLVKILMNMEGMSDVTNEHLLNKFVMAAGALIDQGFNQEILAQLDKEVSGLLTNAAVKNQPLEDNVAEDVDAPNPFAEHDQSQATINADLPPALGSQVTNEEPASSEGVLSLGEMPKDAADL